MVFCSLQELSFDAKPNHLFIVLFFAKQASNFD